MCTVLRTVCCLISTSPSPDPKGTLAAVTGHHSLAWERHPGGLSLSLSGSDVSHYILIRLAWSEISAGLASHMAKASSKIQSNEINPLNPELNPIYLLALLGAHHFLHVSRIRVKLLTFRLLMSFIYGAPILDVSRSHTTTQHSR